MGNLLGPDVNLEISLKEYGLAWEIKESETIFYYGIAYNNEEYTSFDWASVENNMDFDKEFDWADLSEVANFAGSYSLQDWQQMPLISKIQDLLGYYGYENVFGSSYTEGQAYKEIIKGK